MFAPLLSQLDKRGVYTTPDNWMILLDPKPFTERPIHYLEIGAHRGANVLCVAATFASHPDSKLFCCDPWEDYNEYPEYEGHQPGIFDSFKFNLSQFPVLEKKIQYFKDYSHNVIPTFPNDYFDLIYVDGNHQPEFVLEDGVLSFRKLKKDGVMIFDDYNYYGLDVTKRGVDAFLTAYRDRIDYIGFYGGQIFLRKK
jgi:predicted O-methyltransferase YrrM